jgi:prevent-host-death family protein
MDEPPRTVGLREARACLGKLIDAAHYGGQPTILTNHDEPRAVIVPYAWWVQQRVQQGR